MCVVLLFQRGSVAPTLSSRMVPNSSLLPLLSQAILSLHSLTTLSTLPQYTSHSRSLSCTCTTVPSGCLRGGVCEEGGGVCGEGGRKCEVGVHESRSHVTLY